MQLFDECVDFRNQAFDLFEAFSILASERLTDHWQGSPLPRFCHMNFAHSVAVTLSFFIVRILSGEIHALCGRRLVWN